MPAGLLRRYVREILWISSDAPRGSDSDAGDYAYPGFPADRLRLVQDQALPCSVVSGLQQKTRIVEHSACSSLQVVRFTEIAPAILHQPADGLYNHTSALDALLPQCEVVFQSESGPLEMGIDGAPYPFGKGRRRSRSHASGR